MLISLKNFPESKIYRCGGVEANYLMEEQHIPLLNRDGGVFAFSKTEELEKAIAKMPFRYRIRIFFA